MATQVLKQYIVTVFSDGSMKVVEQKGKLREYECPNSVKQITAIIEKAMNKLGVSPTKGDISKAVSQAIREVAVEMGVTTATAHAKITRYLEISMADFKDLIKDYYCNLILGKDGVPEIITFLKATVEEKCRNNNELEESLICIDDMDERVRDDGHRPINWIK